MKIYETLQQANPGEGAEFQGGNRAGTNLDFFGGDEQSKAPDQAS